MKKIIVALLGLIAFNINAQEQKLMNSAEIAKSLDRFGTLGSVLYLAAHPDDENTRLISYFANEKNYRTAYLSLTRGDGGQNLIGDEKGALLGLIRTQELLEARKRDGGEQFFTRAVDFGYSKNADETFTKWDRDAVLSDVVFTIRKYQPDVIVTRFNPTGYNGHGHHSASAILAMEAFELAGDKTAYPEQLKVLKPWQAKSLYFNSSSWWDKDLPLKAANNPDYLAVDVGSFEARTGKWTNEIAAESRSQHKSQGFGVSKWRGEMLEYMKYLKGEKADKDLFSGIKSDWSRVDGGYKIKTLLEEVQFKFDFKAPHKSLSDLLKIRSFLIEDVKDGNWKEVKLKELDNIILSCAGVWLDAVSLKAKLTPGENFDIEFTALNSGPSKVVLSSLSCASTDTLTKMELPFNKAVKMTFDLENEKETNSQPYWLQKPYKEMFVVSTYNMLGKPENDPEYTVTFNLSINGKELSIDRKLAYKWTTRVEGERYKPLRLTPEFSINTNNKQEIFSGNKPKTINVKVKAHVGGLSGVLKPIVPNAWKVEPAGYEVSFVEEGESDYSFEITPPFVAQNGDIRFELKSGEKLFTKGYRTIDYAHIDEQVFFPEAKVQLIRLDVLHRVRKIGYIQGAGDEIPQSLANLGIQVDMLELNSLGTTNLAQYDAIIAGIRAYNTQKQLKFANALLLDYVFEGGNLIVQYNTNRGLVMEDIGPNPFKISRDRVTVESAEPKFLLPDHPILNAPNKLGEEDFENWVQERGLYFANEWDDDFQAIIEWNDPGEKPMKGGLITCPHGKGNFVYTGISFFRQLPAGVPGAYRLFANIISYRR